jgi:hemerythrin
MGITWREDLAVGVEQIDDQHKELLARFDLLLSACKQGKGSEEVLHLLDFLDEYVIRHFGDEEQLQKKTGFPDYTAHSREHAAFIGRVAELKERMRIDGGIQIDHVLDTNKLLFDWLIQHISVRDRQIGRHIETQALS